MGFSEAFIQQVRESADIVEVVSEYVSLRKKGGRNYFGLCPFHQEKTPSFSVNPDRQIFHCFGCGKGGNVFTFLMEVDRISFPDAVRRVAEKNGIKLPDQDPASYSQNERLYRANEIAFQFFHQYLLETKNSETEFTWKYLEQRGVTRELVERFDIGLSPDRWDALLLHSRKHKIAPEIMERAGLLLRRENGGWYDRFRGRLMFPIRNASRKVVAFGGRILKEDPEHPSPKYINSPEGPIYQKGYMVYGLPQARDPMRQEGTAILVEGYTDLIALHSVDFPASVATLGTALTGHQAALVKRYANKAILLYDADKAGINAAFRGADILVGAGLETAIAFLPEGEDPDSLARKGGHDAIAEVLESARSIVDSKIDFFKRQELLNSPQGKSDATRSLIETVRRMPDKITQQYAIQEIAQKLGIDERVLSKEMQRIPTPSGRGGEISNGVGDNLTSLDWIMGDLLLFLLNHEDYRSEFFSSFKTEDLEGHPLLPAFQLLEEAWWEGAPLAVADLYNRFAENTEMIRLLNALENRSGEEMDESIEGWVSETPIALHMEKMKLQKQLDECKRQLQNNVKGARENYLEVRKKMQELVEKIKYS